MLKSKINPHTNLLLSVSHPLQCCRGNIFVQYVNNINKIYCILSSFIHLDVHLR